MAVDSGKGVRSRILIVLLTVVAVVAAAVGGVLLLAQHGNQAPTGGGSKAPVLASVAISPTTSSLGFGKTQRFSAMAADTSGAPIDSGVTYTWSLNRSALGVLSASLGSNVTFTAGNSAAAGRLGLTGTYNGVSKSATALITVSGPGGAGGPSISSFQANPAVITLGQSTEFQVVASGGTGSLSYAYVGLPPGCASANTSDLGCKPSGPGSYSVTVSVTDAAQKSAEASTGLTVNQSGGGPGGNPPVRGTLLYQPSGANYTAQQAPGTGLLVVPNGTLYRVVIPANLSAALPIAVGGAFYLKVDPSLLGYYDIVKLVPDAPTSNVQPGAEVNVSLTSVSVAFDNLTLGFGTSATNPVAYLAFGTYPTFFSNVTVQGVDLNLSMLNSLLDVNFPLLAGLARAIDSNLAWSTSAVIVVNHTLWLPDQVRIQGQAQVIITPSNVTSFLGSLSSAVGSANLSMVPQAMQQLDEELVVVATLIPHAITYWCLLAPVQLNRTVLSGIVTLDVEASYLEVSLVGGTNPNVTRPGGPVLARVGVTWNRTPVAASGYAAASVPDLWAVGTERAVTLQVPAVGLSLKDAQNALAGMGYSMDQYAVDVASLQNPALFVLTDSSLLQDPNRPSPYTAFAVALVPNDELSLQTSVDLYLTLRGVVYNASYYLGACSPTNLPACPVLVADTIAYGAPPFYMPYQLGSLSTPTFVETTGFLTGTTMKTVGQALGGFSDLISYSPVDVGVYDLGYSNGAAGYNLAAVYFTWGLGPTLQVTNNITQGLYIPLPLGQVSAYLSNFSAYIGSLGWNTSLIQAFQSYLGSLQEDLFHAVFNGSVAVPGVLVMMDLWGNASAGNLTLQLSGGGTGPCSSFLNVSLGQCIVANLSLSANSAAFLNPPGLAGVLTNLTGSTDYNLSTSSCVWSAGVPVSCGTLGAMACLPFGLCALGPYHVVNVTLYTCYQTTLLGGLCFWNVVAAGTYDVAYALFWNGTEITVTPSFRVTLS